ncbi:poly(A) polymerase/tRNA nucleotidyltransferase (CCA-adding enzyme) [Alkalispirochaeta americana]|uniref:Poly(A) polymerase/tRNA nucleotidyltransferase (CCA-adding enzyme) n=2 Tax=Alkalispirochaeta americana TaxID=159291 RepID=A0A1N6X4N4_9SPIO|nr:poly(A) polymerase/tRNA nucleotidyltransferase (CCA-adding enzyme) [Alkalispirochaeta americana]
MLHVPSTIRAFASVFSREGYELYIVGGAVRDALLGKAVDDYDFATSATPEEVQGLFRRVIPTGVQHGTVTVLFQDHSFEVTTYRIDGLYTDHRRPDTIAYTRSLEEDLRRRDLTINAIALNPETGEVVDPLGGRADLKERVIRTVGSGDDRFQEDALRMVRAVRFAATLDFALLPDVAEAIRRHAPLLGQVSQERIAQELEKLMRARHPSSGWRLFRDTGLLEQFLPELEEDRETPSPVFEHLLGSCDCAPLDPPHLRWAALFHDIGKPRCCAEDEKGRHFHGHDQVSASMAEEVLGRLRFSKERIRSVAHLVRHHMFGYTSEWSDAAVRRFISRVGEEEVFLLTALRRADICSKLGRPPVLPDLDELEGRIRCMLEEGHPLTRKDLAVNGRDLMSQAGIPSGPALGIVLEELLETILDDPSMNRPETLLEIARAIYQARFHPSREPRDKKG